jgi:hypothetical protein
MSSAARKPSPEFPKGVTPAQAIAFALSICGIPVGRNHGMVAFIIHALEKCGFKIVPISAEIVSFPRDRERQDGATA